VPTTFPLCQGDPYAGWSFPSKDRSVRRSCNKVEDNNNNHACDCSLLPLKSVASTTQPSLPLPRGSRLRRTSVSHSLVSSLSRHVQED
jgi:hypothetical protein